MLIVIRLLFILALTIPASGQHNSLKFDHLTVEDGLSQGAIYTIMEDSRGFMWFGTRFGLNRYDGHEFRIFSHDPTDATSLPNYRVLALQEDQTGAIWVGTETGGLAKYDRNTEKFTNFCHDSLDNKSLSSNIVTSLYEDIEGTLWIGTKNGLNKFDPQTNSFIKYFYGENDSSSLGVHDISALGGSSSGLLFIGMRNGNLATLDIYSGVIRDYNSGPFVANETSDHSFKDILFDPKNNCIWLSKFRDGIIRFNLNDQSYKQYVMTVFAPQVISVNYPYGIDQDEDGRIWVGTVGGLTIFNPETESYIFNTHDEMNPTSISAQIVYSVLIDSQGIVWAGTESKGLNIYKPNRNRFDLVQHDPNKTQTASANMVFSFAEDDLGDIWFTTIPGGTNRYRPSEGSYRYYQSDDRNPNVWSINYAQQILIDSHGAAWIATTAAGISVVDPNNGTRLNLFYYKEGQPNSLSDHTILALTKQADGTIWAGSRNYGLNRYNREENNFTRFHHDPSDPTSISDDYIYAIYEDSQSVLWIGTSQGGLNRYHPETESFVSYKYSDTNDNCIQSNCVLAIKEDSKGNLWIGTRGGGLNKLDPSRQNWTTLDLGAEHIDIITYSIEEDDHGFLWLSTNNGLIKADPVKGLLNRYTKADGLQGNEFLYNSSMKDSRGNLYFGGPNGFNKFHPDSVYNNSHIPPVVITSLKINYEDVPIGEMADGRTILSKSITETNNILLSYKDHTISFTYSALDFIDTERNRFAYMLEYFDDEWVNAGTSHRATYTSLEPGSYIFRVKGTNNDGLWNEEGVSLGITVLPPFWQTWWFRMLISISIILTMYTYIRLRLRRLESEKLKLEKLVTERTAELKIEIESKMQLKVDHLKRELVSKSVCATQKQEIMNNLFQELKDIQRMDATEMRDRFNRIVRYFKELFKSGEEWGEFEKWFTEVHTDFFKNIRKRYPELSQREVKVCALLKLNLLSKDIANLMNVQPKTVDIYRHRIRKKMGMAPDENLNRFLIQF